MNQHKFVSSFAWIAALLVATPAMGQLANFPVLAMAPGDAGGVTTVTAGFARGLNDNSREQSSFGAEIARGMERVSFGAGAGYVASATDALTLSGNIAAHLLSDSNSPVQVSLQSGLGWMSQDVGALSATTLLIPIGVAIQGNGDGNVRPWVMPRFNFARSSGSAFTTSSTQKKFGASAGVSIATEAGVGVSLALDLQRSDNGTGLADESRVGFSVAMTYIVGG